MRYIMLALLCAAALACTSAAPFITTSALNQTPGGAGQGALFDQACAAAGVRPEQVGIDALDLGLWGGGKYAPPLLKVFMDDPWKISPYTRTLTGQLLQSAADPAKLLMAMQARTGHGVRLGLVDDTLAPYTARAAELGADSLALALGELTGEPKEHYNTPRPDDDYDGLPPSVRDAAALLCLALPDILAYRRQALEEPLLGLGLNPQAVYAEVLRRTLPDTEDDDISADRDYSLRLERVLDSVDFELLNAGAVLAALVAQQMRTKLEAPDSAAATAHYRFTADTPYGKLVLASSLDAPLTAPGLLSVVASGDDTYLGAACTHSFSQPVSIVLDLGGDDRYLGAEDGLPCGLGLLGYAVLLDCAGDDTYAAELGGAGCGVLGAGLVLDAAGADHYRSAGACGQGCGIYGTGVLADLAGSDVYELGSLGQGYGGTLGAGLLLDAAGDDSYTGLETPGRENGGPFGAQHFIHFTQGAAYGRRADYTDGHSWAGGVGLLLDGAGNDSYSCDVYGQGTGYWYGLGLCVDKAGDDVHRAGWYSLGGSPHFACGVLQDDGGNDRYICRVMQSLGNARDFSVAWFEDSVGDDFYQGGVMTFGVGDINGIGCFWDKAGADTYIAKGPCLGQSRIETAGSLRDTMLTLGLFVDGGGADRYLTLPGDVTPSGAWTPEQTDLAALPVLDFCGDGRQWARPADQHPCAGALGGGVDAP